MEAPQFFETEMNPSDHFTVDDLLDISNGDDGDDDDDDRDALTGDDAVISGISPMINDPHVESCHSSHCTTPSLPFDEKLSVPYDDLADLEWLSNFVEDCFSGEDMEKLEVKASSMQSQWVSRSPQNSGQPSSQFVVGVPGKARSKRSRSALRSCWRSSPLTSSASSSADCGAACFDEKSSMISRVERVAAAGRKCLHCATDKTPQWRTGPMGPKTLCNACGVRYKSGRLVPEYRPAASPTFEQTKHSNSHRKVLELRRHKENERTQNQERHLCYDNLLFHDHHSTHRQLQLGTGLTWLT